MVSAKSAYLILYNLASAAGWGAILFLAVQHRLADKPAKALWSSIDLLLTVTVTTAGTTIIATAIVFHHGGLRRSGVRTYQRLQ
jgi:hypothetical protein